MVFDPTSGDLKRVDIDFSQWENELASVYGLHMVGSGLGGLWWWYDNGEVCADVLMSGRYGLGGLGQSLSHERLGMS
jgi:hypothetical protein